MKAADSGLAPFVPAHDARHGRVLSVYLLSSERKHYLEAAERAAARGFRLLRIPGAGHDVMLTRPAELSDALPSLTH